MTSHAESVGPDGTRRDFLSLIATAGAVIGAAAIGWTLIDSMNPSADVIAAGAPIDVDLTPLAPGQQVIVLWRGAPILDRPPHAGHGEDPARAGPAHPAGGPEFRGAQQPPYAQNWHRSIEHRIRRAGRHLHASRLPAELCARHRMPPSP